MRLQPIILSAFQIFRIGLDCGDTDEMYLNLQNKCI